MGLLSTKKVLPVNAPLWPFISHPRTKPSSSSQPPELELIGLQNRCFDSIRQVSLEEFTHLATWTVASELMTFKLQISAPSLFSHQMNELIIPALEARLPVSTLRLPCALAPHYLPGPRVCSGLLGVSPHAGPAPLPVPSPVPTG